jgi:hypothetical protein
MPIRRRLILLTSLSALGGLLFAPFVLAGMRAGGATHIPSTLVLAAILCAGSAVVAALCAWAGLRFADRMQLPMPILRAWEQRTPIADGTLGRTLLPAIGGGLAAGLLIGGVVHLLPIPSNPGTLAVRLLTVFFAATVTEIIVHLFAMSALFALFRRRWLAILLSSVLFVLIFHTGQIGSPWITATILLANFAFGTLTGWMYSRYGFESAVLTHGVAHLIALGWN